MSKILQELEIFGVSEENENAILTGLFTGDPILFMGAPGTAKTECVIVLANCLRELSKRKHLGNKEKLFNFHIYDSSKLNFEELLGIPNPDKMKQGLMEFIETPTTIWNKKLVSFDELNRAEPDRLSNILEILRNRTCFGIPTGTFFIFNAMNPYGDAGTNILSEALVDRHSLFLEFPDFKDMETEDKEKIIHRAGSFDGVALKYWTKAKRDLDVSNDPNKVNEKLANIGLKLTELLQESAKIYEELKEVTGKKLRYLILKTFDIVSNSFTTDAADSNNAKATLLSGRRAGLVYRVLLSYRAVEIAKAKIFGTPIEPMVKTISAIYPMCLPFGISGAMPMELVEKAKRILIENISLFWSEIENDQLTNNILDHDLIYELFGSGSLARKLQILLTIDIANDAVKTSAWNTLASNLTGSGQEEQKRSVKELLSVISMILPELIPDNIKGSVTSIIPENRIETGPSTLSLDGNMKSLSKMIVFLKEKWQTNPLVTYFLVTSIQGIKNNLPKNTLISKLLEIDSACDAIARKLSEKPNDSPVSESIG